MEVSEGNGKVACTGVVLLLILSGLVIMVGFVPESAEGAFRYVGPDSTYDTLQAALDAATSGDIIVLAGGTINGSFSSDKSGLLIRGNSSFDTVIMMNASDDSYLGGNDTTMRGLTLANGTLWSTGDRFNGTNLRAGSGSVLKLKDVKNSRLRNVTFVDPDHTALEVINCTSLSTDYLISAEVNGDLIDITGSTNLRMDRTFLSLNSSSKGVRIDSSEGVFITDLQLTSVNSSNIGIEVGNSSDIRILDSIVFVSGTGLSFDSVDGIRMSEVTVSPNSNGSVGLKAELVLNLTMNGMNAYGAYDSSIMDIGMSSNILLTNSSVIMDGPATGFRANDCANVTLSELDMDGSGNFSTGADLSRIDGAYLTIITWTGEGQGSSFLMSDGCEDLRVNDSDISVKGADGRGIAVTGVDGAAVHDLVLTSHGTTVRGMSVEGADAWIYGNLITVSGAENTGMEVSGDNMTITGNIVTATGDDSISAVISGAEVKASSERWFAVGERSLAVMIDQLTELEMAGCRADSSGSEGRSMVISGTGGTYDIKDSVIVGSEAISDLAVINDPSGLTYLDNTSITSASTANALTVTSLTISIEDSSISGSGPAALFMDTLSARMMDSASKGSVAIRSVGSAVVMDSCDLGNSALSVESLTGSDVHVINTPLQGVSVDASSRVLVSNSIRFRTVDRFGDPIRGVDLKVLSGDRTIYSTEFYNGTDPVTNLNGTAGPVLVDHVLYEGDPDPDPFTNLAMVHLEGTSPLDWNDEHEFDASGQGTVTLVSPDIDLPSVPSDVTARPLDTREALLLSWVPNEDDTLEYRIYTLDMEDMSTWYLIDKVTHPMASWRSEDIGPSIRRLYRVTAWDGTWESAFSGIANAETKDLTPPPAPFGLAASSVDQDSITLTWTFGGAGDLEVFHIYMNRTSSTELEMIDSLAPSERTYTVEGLKWDTSYRFRVRALDTSGNPSNLSSLLEVRTSMIPLRVRVSANYSDEGPLAGMPVFNGTVSLISFNGTEISSEQLDVGGRAVFTVVDLDELYRVRVSAPPEYRGEENATDGYLSVISDIFQLSEDQPEVEMDLTLTYHMLPRVGSVEVEVVYGDGPREGVAFQAQVTLLDGDGNVVGTKLTDPTGRAFFRIEDLPFSGRFRVEAPEGIAGDEEQKISGYLGRVTEVFSVDRDRPDMGLLRVELQYFEYEAPPEELRVNQFGPKGGGVALDSEIFVSFNLPVNRQSVEDSFEIVPAVGGVEFFWDNAGMNLTVTHDGLLSGTNYTVIIGTGARSLAGTSFPDGYENNQWTFKTVVTGDGDEDDGEEGISNEVLWLILIALIVVIVLVGFYLWSSKRTEEELDEEEMYDLSDEEFPDEEYPGLEDEPEEEEEDLFAEEEEGELEELEEEEELYAEDEEEEELPEEEEVEVEEEEDEMLEEDEEMMEEEAPETEEEGPKEPKRKKKNKKK